jgi:hypothetical protein
MFLYNSALNKAKSLKEGDMVSWNSSGGRATGKVVHVMDYGTLDIPNTKFKIKGEKDNPAVLIQLYRDGKETDIQVGHKMSSLTKSIDEQLLKHGSHNQQSHAGSRGGGGFDSAGRGGGVDSTGRQASESRNNELTSKASEKVSDIQVTLNNLNDADSGDRIENISDDDQRILDGALSDLGEAEEQLNLAYDAQGTRNHLDKIDNALVRLDDAYDGLKNADNSELKAVMQDVDDITGELEDFYGELLGR